MNAVHAVLPSGIDDVTRPSGGNAYDRRVCAGLVARGWTVHEYPLPGSWPRPDAAARAALSGTLAGIPDGAVVLIDGLIGSVAPSVLARESRRLRVVVLVHMPFGDAPAGHEVPRAVEREGAALTAATAVITTSAWTRVRIVGRYGLRPERVHVATPGVDPAGLAPGSADGGRLLCVAAVAPFKGHDLLLAALSSVADLPWRCDVVGALDRDPAFVARLRAGAGDRVRFRGPLTGAALDRAYATADLLVHPSRVESYGMVVTEALARGLPVVAGAVGGVPEALGRTPDGRLPGLLVPPDDERALSTALRLWLGDAALRRDLRTAAAQRRTELGGWDDTARRVARVLSEVAADERTPRRVRISSQRAGRPLAPGRGTARRRETG